MLPGTFAYAYFGVAGCGVIDALSSGELRVTELPHEVWLQLGGAILVPAFSAVFLARAAADSDLVSVQTVILEGSRDGVDFGAVFNGVFYAAALSLFIAFIFQSAMKELPLRKALDSG